MPYDMYIDEHGEIRDPHNEWYPQIFGGAFDDHTLPNKNYPQLDLACSTDAEDEAHWRVTFHPCKYEGCGEKLGVYDSYFLTPDVYNGLSWKWGSVVKRLRNAHGMKKVLGVGNLYSHQVCGEKGINLTRESPIRGKPFPNAPAPRHNDHPRETFFNATVFFSRWIPSGVERVLFQYPFENVTKGAGYVDQHGKRFGSFDEFGNPMGTFKLGSAKFKLSIPMQSASGLPDEFLSDYKVKILDLNMLNKVKLGSSAMGVDYRYHDYIEFVGPQLRSSPIETIFIPLDRNATGGVIVLRSTGNNTFAATQFNPEFGSGISIGPGVLHFDNLKGDWRTFVPDDEYRSYDPHFVIRTSNGTTPELETLETREDCVDSQAWRESSELSRTFFNEIGGQIGLFAALLQMTKEVSAWAKKPRKVITPIGRVEACSLLTECSANLEEIDVKNKKQLKRLKKKYKHYKTKLSRFIEVTNKKSALGEELKAIELKIQDEGLAKLKAIENAIKEVSWIQDEHDTYKIALSKLETLKERNKLSELKADIDYLLAYASIIDNPKEIKERTGKLIDDLMSITKFDREELFALERYYKTLSNKRHAFKVEFDYDIYYPYEDLIKKSKCPGALLLEIAEIFFMIKSFGQNVDCRESDCIDAEKALTKLKDEIEKAKKMSSKIDLNAEEIVKADLIILRNKGFNVWDDEIEVKALNHQTFFMPNTKKGARVVAFCQKQTGPHAS